MDELISAVEKMRRVQMDYEASHRNPYFAKEKKRLEAVVDEIVRKHKGRQIKRSKPIYLTKVELSGGRWWKLSMKNY